MPLVIDRNKMVDDTAFDFENRLKSKAAQFQETPPTFVTYYHISEDDTMTDVGFNDVESIVGKRSPVRYKRIKDFPISGLEQILLQIEDNDYGLDTTFSGEGTINPGTLKPLQNDFFKIPYLKGFYLFRVTEVNYDVLISNTYYKIVYQLESIEEERYNQIDNQLVGTFNCIMDNIGTDQHAIIEEEYVNLLSKIHDIYNDIVDTMISVFYDETHNVLIYNDGLKLFYDPLATEFINKHGLLNDRNKIKTYMLSDQFKDSLRKIKYEKSVYRFIERKNLDGMNNFGFYMMPLIAKESSFYQWGVNNVYYIDIPINNCAGNVLDLTKLFSDEFVITIAENKEITTQSSYAKLIATYLLNDELSITDIPLDLNQYMINMCMTMEVFLLTPIILYIIRDIEDRFLKKKRNI